MPPKRTGCSCCCGRALDAAGLCAEAALGGLAALAVVSNGELARTAALRGLLVKVADEAADAARSAGLRVTGRPAELAARRCRQHPRQQHPWLRALRAGRPTGADALFGPLLYAARRAGGDAGRLAVIAAVLRRLEKTR